MYAFHLAPVRRFPPPGSRLPAITCLVSLLILFGQRKLL